jgi:predicted RNA-binding protein Jag
MDISGADSELLQAEGGELLLALQHLLNQAFGRTAPEGQRIVCDVEGFRATREAELRAMANLAAARVIHLTLADCEDLFTESVGEGYARKLRVALKSS